MKKKLYYHKHSFLLFQHHCSYNSWLLFLFFLYYTYGVYYILGGGLDRRQGSISDACIAINAGKYNVF